MPEYNEQNIQQHLNGMTDVADVVYRIINEEYFRDFITPESLTVVMKRQIDHLNLMLGMEHIQTSGVDLQYFEQAKNDGNVWINNNQ